MNYFSNECFFKIQVNNMLFLKIKKCSGLLSCSYEDETRKIILPSFLQNLIKAISMVFLREPSAIRCHIIMHSFWCVFSLILATLLNIKKIPYQEAPLSGEASPRVADYRKYPPPGGTTAYKIRAIFQTSFGILDL